MSRLWLFLTRNLWAVLSVLASLYLWVVHQYVSFPPTKPLTATSATGVGLVWQT